MIQLLYSSVSVLDERGALGEQGVTQIISQSYLNNMRRGVTGILLHGDGLFLQLLEGSTEAIEEAMQYIAIDRRHRNVRILAKRAIDYYSLPYSPMACAGFMAKIPHEIRQLVANTASSDDRDVANQTADRIRDYLLSQAREDDLDARLRSLASQPVPTRGAERGIAIGGLSGLLAKLRPQRVAL